MQQYPLTSHVRGGGVVKKGGEEGGVKMILWHRIKIPHILPTIITTGIFSGLSVTNIAWTTIGRHDNMCVVIAATEQYCLQALSEYS